MPVWVDRTHQVRAHDFTEFFCFGFGFVFLVKTYNRYLDYF